MSETSKDVIVQAADYFGTTGDGAKIALWNTMEKLIVWAQLIEKRLDEAQAAASMSVNSTSEATDELPKARTIEELMTEAARTRGYNKAGLLRFRDNGPLQWQALASHRSDHLKDIAKFANTPEKALQFLLDQMKR
jgi:hypothetical protein